MLSSASANVRRLAASALGKLAWLGMDQVAAVAALAPVARRDPHPQDLPGLDRLLADKLHRYGFSP